MKTRQLKAVLSLILARSRKNKPNITAEKPKRMPSSLIRLSNMDARRSLETLGKPRVTSEANTIMPKRIKDDAPYSLSDFFGKTLRYCLVIFYVNKINVHMLARAVYNMVPSSVLAFHHSKISFMFRPQIMP